MKRIVTLATVALFMLAATFADAKPAVRTLADMIRAGRFDHVNSSITKKNFPVKPERFRAARLEVFRYDHLIITAVLADIDRRGFRPATIEELLTYAKRSWNGNDWVVALGSTWVNPDGHRYVPYLCGYGGGRELDLLWDDPEHRWCEVCLFLVVRK